MPKRAGCPGSFVPLIGPKRSLASVTRSSRTASGMSTAPVAARCSTPTGRDSSSSPMTRRNPYLHYHEMQSVLTRSLEIYQRGHFGRVPDKITIHKNTEFKKEEILG